MTQIEEKAREHIESIFSEIAKLLHSPWPKFHDALIAIYLAGAHASLANQWRDPKNELPKFGDEFILRYRTKYEGSWLTITIVDKRREWADPFDEENKEIIAWMPIPAHTENRYRP